jgi:hypothetical protein
MREESKSISLLPNISDSNVSRHLSDNEMAERFEEALPGVLTARPTTQGNPHATQLFSPSNARDNIKPLNPNVTSLSAN